MLWTTSWTSLDRLEAGAEKEALARELREQAAGLRRVVTLLDLD
jgi:hypothetical protein